MSKRSLEQKNELKRLAKDLCLITLEEASCLNFRITLEISYVQYSKENINAVIYYNDNLKQFSSYKITSQKVAWRLFNLLNNTNFKRQERLDNNTVVSINYINHIDYYEIVLWYNFESVIELAKYIPNGQSMNNYIKRSDTMMRVDYRRVNK